MSHKKKLLGSCINTIHMPSAKSSNNPNRLPIGQNIRKWRDLKGIKQELLATDLGITKSALSNIENNKTGISLRRIEDIASCLGIETISLFCDPLDLLLSAKEKS